VTYGCHSERSEESRSGGRMETLRSTQGDMGTVLLECLNTTTLHSSRKADTGQALKGLHKIAQGNALGHKRKLHFLALKGRNE